MGKLSKLSHLSSARSGLFLCSGPDYDVPKVPVAFTGLQYLPAWELYCVLIIGLEHQIEHLGFTYL